MQKREALALGALAAILSITIGWWVAALWPLPASTPEWVARARAACFGSTQSGLPDAGGWILLIGTPITMVIALSVIWGRDLRDALRHLAATAGGRRVLLGSGALMVVLLVSAYARVVTAAGYGRFEESTSFSFSAQSMAAQRLNREAPPLPLVDQSGETVNLAQFRGRPVLLTFAYGKCETVCPVIVRNVLDARDELPEEEPAVLVVTLDPWRDTPARLPHLARSWGLPADARLLGGEVAQVEAMLDALQVARVRDPNTGEISHPSLVYVIGPYGKIEYAVTGNREQIVQAVRRL